jgi:hypothetical protein
MTATPNPYPDVPLPADIFDAVRDELVRAGGSPLATSLGGGRR